MEQTAQTDTRFPRALLAVQFAAATLYAWLVWCSRFDVDGRTYFSLFDDAMISMTYARNVAQGHGFVWFPGYAPVEGFTNFLWVMFMAALHWLPIPENLLCLPVMVAGATLLLAQNGLVWRLTADIAGNDGRFRHAPLIATVFVAFSYPMLFWTLRGMEVGLVSVLVLAAARGAIRATREERLKPLAWSALWLGLAQATRPDAIVPWIVIAGWTMLVMPGRMRVRAALMLGVALVVPWGALTAFRLSVFGDPLPNTYYLKLGGVPLVLRVAAGAARLATAVRENLFGLLVPIPLLSMARGMAVPFRQRLLLTGAMAWSLCAYNVYTGGDAWELETFCNRFLTGAIPWMAAIAALGLCLLPVLLGRLPARWRLWICLIVATMPVALANRARILFEATNHAAYPDWWNFLVSLQECAVVALVPALLSWRLPRAESALAPRLVRFAVPATAISMWLCLNLGSIVSAQLDSVSHKGLDEAWTRRAIRLREVTAPDTSFALTWAGAFPYFSHRPCVDLLGKCDRRIAHSAPHIEVTGIYPGHMKWDYAYSLSTFRPDVIAGLWRDNGTLEAALAEGGYEHVRQDWYVRGDSDRATTETISLVLDKDGF